MMIKRFKICDYIKKQVKGEILLEIYIFMKLCLMTL